MRWPRSRRHPRRPASRRQGKGGAPVGGRGRAARGAPRARGRARPAACGHRAPRSGLPVAPPAPRLVAAPVTGARTSRPTPPGGAGGELAAAPHHRPCCAGGADAVRGLDGVWLGLCPARAPFAVPRLAAGRVVPPPPAGTCECRPILLDAWGLLSLHGLSPRGASPLHPLPTPTPDSRLCPALVSPLPPLHCPLLGSPVSPAAPLPAALTLCARCRAALAARRPSRGCHARGVPALTALPRPPAPRAVGPLVAPHAVSVV